MQSCFFPIASASAAGRRLRPLQLLPCSQARLRQAHPLPLLLPVCLRFHLLLPIASASAATPRLRPLQLLLPDCVRFNCCSALQLLLARLRPLQLLLPDCIHPLAGFSPGPMFSNILRGVRGSVNKLKYEGRASL